LSDKVETNAKNKTSENKELKEKCIIGWHKLYYFKEVRRFTSWDSWKKDSCYEGENGHEKRLYI